MAKNEERSSGALNINANASGYVAALTNMSSRYVYHLKLI